MTKAERQKIRNRLVNGHLPPDSFGVIRDSFDHIDALEAQDNEKVQAIVQLDATIFKLIAENGKLEAQLEQRDEEIYLRNKVIRDLAKALHQEHHGSGGHFDCDVCSMIAETSAPEFQPLATAAKAGEGK